MIQRFWWPQMVHEDRLVDLNDRETMAEEDRHHSCVNKPSVNSPTCMFLRWPALIQ
jgi:hypothetical protein